METTRVSSKGQIVLPKELRDAYGWGAGTDLVIERGPGSSLMLRCKDTIQPTTIDAVAGCLKYNGSPVSLEDMERGIEQELRGRWLRKGQ
jgi:AbrB family looped-hinge helix DNA binding protein